MDLEKSTNPTRSAIRAGLSLCHLLPNAQEAKSATLEGWSQLLDGCGTPAEIEAAFTKHLRTVKWFPAPAEIITLVKAIRREKAEARKREIDQVDALPAPKKSPEVMDLERIERAKIRAGMTMGARQFMESRRRIPSDVEDVIITKEDLDRRDAMIAQLRAGR